MKKVVLLICLVFVLVSCGENKVIKDSNIEVKVDKNMGKSNIEIRQKKEKFQEIKEKTIKIDVEEKKSVNEIFSIDLNSIKCNDWFPKLIKNWDTYYIARSTENEEDINNLLLTWKSKIYPWDYYPFSIKIVKNINNLDNVNKEVLKKSNWLCNIQNIKDWFLEKESVSPIIGWPDFSCAYMDFVYKNNTMAILTYWQEYFCWDDSKILKTFKFKNI